MDSINSKGFVKEGKNTLSFIDIASILNYLPELKLINTKIAMGLSLEEIFEIIKLQKIDIRKYSDQVSFFHSSAFTCHSDGNDKLTIEQSMIFLLFLKGRSKKITEKYKNTELESDIKEQETFMNFILNDLSLKGKLDFLKYEYKIFKFDIIEINEEVINDLIIQEKGEEKKRDMKLQIDNFRNYINNIQTLEKKKNELDRTMLSIKRIYNIEVASDEYKELTTKMLEKVEETIKQDLIKYEKEDKIKNASDNCKVTYNISEIESFNVMHIAFLRRDLDQIETLLKYGLKIDDKCYKLSNLDPKVKISLLQKLFHLDDTVLKKNIEENTLDGISILMESFSLQNDDFLNEVSIILNKQQKENQDIHKTPLYSLNTDIKKGL